MSAPLLLFAPGAGAPSSHQWMQGWAQRLSSIGRVQLFDYDYMRQGRRYPDRLPELVAAHRGALAAARRQAGENVILIGKSMGGRVGCHLALEEDVPGVVCLGYPLCGGSNRAKLRDEVLRKLETPVLFVQGTRDPLCPLDLLEKVRRDMKAPNVLEVVEGANHSLLVPKRDLARAGQTQNDVDKRIVHAIGSFIAEVSRSDC